MFRVVSLIFQPPTYLLDLYVPNPLNVQIDVLVLYTSKAMSLSDNARGSINSSAQMESDIVGAYSMANDALTDSGVNVTLNIVHMQHVRNNPATTAMRAGRLDNYVGRFENLLTAVL